LVDPVIGVGVGETHGGKPPTPEGRIEKSLVYFVAPLLLSVIDYHTTAPVVYLTCLPLMQ